MPEVMTTMVILAILGAIAIPQFLAQMPTYRLNGVARFVMGELMWARMKAVQENNQFVVSFPTATSVTILDDTNGNGGADGGEWTRTRDLLTDYPGVTLSKNVAHPNPTFSSKGTAGGTTEITVTNGSGSRTVTVNIAGNVTIN